MTRMIERWFPCQEVSENSDRGWGSGNSEVMLFSWFAKRPLAQARAAILTSLLPWPSAKAEQQRLQNLVRSALSDINGVSDELRTAINEGQPSDVAVLDPFSGRGMIPLEAARLGLPTWALDYSPVACVGSRLLIDYPMRDWNDEAELPIDGYQRSPLGERLPEDLQAFLDEIREVSYDHLAEYYPAVNGKRPWGYLWATAIKCQECGNRFPMVGSLTLRSPNSKKSDPGQSLFLRGDLKTSQLVLNVESGPPTASPTRVIAQGKSKYDSAGKVVVCCFCGHVHSKDVHTRLVAEGEGVDILLAVADNNDQFQRVFRLPSKVEQAAYESAQKALLELPGVTPNLSAVPDERIPAGNTWTIQGQVFGAKTYGDLCNPRQNLSFAILSESIRELGKRCLGAGVTPAYTQALSEYACAVLARRLKFSTRGARLRTPTGGVNVSDVFGNSESSWSYQYDYLETGITEGPGTWSSLSHDTISVLKRQYGRRPGSPAKVLRGSATSLPFADNRMTVVVTDPPYDAMIDYNDASDIYYVWMKRALADIDPSFGVVGDKAGLQEKSEEIIVKKGQPVGDHRTQAHYDRLISRAFSEARRVVADDGIVTIVFGHGDPDVWHRLLAAVSAAELVLTGSWPARTEKEKAGGGSNIVTTLTLACRPAPPGRHPGRVAEVDAEVRKEIKNRISLWDVAGLALTDQLMASAGPAMEVVGRYSQVLDKAGIPVALDRYLPLARQMVQEAADIRIDDLPLGTFDERTRFALFWAKAFGRAIAPGSEARWQRLAADLDDAATEGILKKDGKGVRLAFANEAALSPEEVAPDTPVIDVVMAMVADGKSLAYSAEVLLAADRVDDPYVWAAVRALSDAVPEADPDGEAWTYLVRNRQAVVSSTHNVAAVKQREAEQSEAASAQMTMDLGDA
jgi:putative DNA methylase